MGWNIRGSNPGRERHFSLLPNAYSEAASLKLINTGDVSLR
jgi:hypothetical protein